MAHDMQKKEQAGWFVLRSTIFSAKDAERERHREAMQELDRQLAGLGICPCCIGPRSVCLIDFLREGGIIRGKFTPKEEAMRTLQETLPEIDMENLREAVQGNVRLSLDNWTRISSFVAKKNFSDGQNLQ